jgi:subtilisin-like proprotein convertase family protein
MMNRVFVSFIRLTGTILGLGCYASWAVIVPEVVPAGDETYDPLYYTGGIEVDYLGRTYFASGAVAGHPRMVIGCAHLNYEPGVGWFSAGTTRWFHMWNRNGKPKDLGESGLTLSGYYKFSGYATFADSDPDPDFPGAATFSRDYVIHYHAAANTANGYFAPLMEESSSFLLAKSAVRKPIWKMISGYPSDQYNPGDPGEYRMHETVSFTNRGSVMFGPYLWISGVTSYGGNSGGPLWGWTNGRWGHTGVLVSSDDTTGAGFVANHALGTGLIFSALRNQFPDSSVWKNEVPVSGTGNIPDAATLVRTFTVSNMLGTIDSVALNLQIRHPRRGDLMVTLTSPRNRTVTVFSTVPIRQSTPAHLATNRLVFGFSGNQPNGVWKLGIKDAYRTRSGTLDAATLSLTTR